MRASRFVRVWGIAAVVVAATLGGEHALGQFGGFGNAGRLVRRSPPSAEQVEQGRTLFRHDWTDRSLIVDTGADGLGPRYNAVSCVACHHLGGTGGAGPAEKNVELLTRTTREGKGPPQGSRGAEFAANVHPEFRTADTVMIHRFLRGEDEQRYATFRQQLLAQNARLPLSDERPRGRVQGLWVHYSQRNTPALFGSGLIDQIPAPELLAVAEEQAQSHPKQAGRVPSTRRGEVGRFGWRGQTSTLHEFVLGACSAELGLNVKGSAEPDGLRVRDTGRGLEVTLISDGKQSVDLTEAQCLALTGYVASLPTPESGGDDTISRAETHAAGRRHFERIGCAVCHRPTLGKAEGIYSDLLLHDMGPGLADPIPAVPENTGGSFGGYYGGSIRPIDLANATTNVFQEWRTPPLWGVGSSAPYLHDGRAATLDDAIRLHGGQGEEAAAEYERLSLEEQVELLSFLQSLVAPLE